VRLEGLGQLKKSNEIGNGTLDLLACSIVPQPTTLPRASVFLMILREKQMSSCCLLGFLFDLKLELPPDNTVSLSDNICFLKQY
jgi:hypothetical protein